MYNRDLAAQILLKLDESFPRGMSVDQLRAAVPRFSALPWEEWEAAIDALHLDRLIGGIINRASSGVIEIIGSLTITQYGRRSVQAGRVGGRDGATNEPVDLDPLLLVYDRGRLDRDLEELGAGASAEAPLSLLVIDLDGFKQVNDSFGHAAGDKVLKIAAQRITKACQGKGTAYRYGGDELCVLLRNFSINEAVAAADRIRREIEALRIAGLPRGVTASIGVASIPESTAEWGQLFDSADKALYESKDAGGNRVSLAGRGTTTPQQAVPRLSPEQIRNRLAPVDLELTIDQGLSHNFLVTVRNNSDEAVTVRKIRLSYDGVKLAESPSPGPIDNWNIAPRGRLPIAWNASNPNPVEKLMRLLHSLDGESEAILDVKIQAEVLGELNTCQSRIQVKVESGSRRIWQI